MVFEKLCELLSIQLGVDESSITPETRIVDDLGADSLDVVEMITSLEDEYNIVITDDHIRDLQTVKDVVQFVENMI